MSPRVIPLLLVVVLATSPAFAGRVAGFQTNPSPPPARMPPAPPDVGRPPSDAKKTESGLAYKVLTPGSGTIRPRATDRVVVHYTGWTTNGKAFDSTTVRGRPATIALDRVMKGMTEGVQLMVVGEKARFWVPQDLAYAGARGRPSGMVVFDVELIDIETPPSQAPPDVAAPPADAMRTPSGLAYKVLRPGTGPARAAPTSRVTVHYTGWTTDGKMFDSSVTRGQPATFALDEVVKGWTEGVQLMAIGEKARFWIPQELAYQGKAGSPAGMLVFDIELLAIEQ